MDVIHRVRQLGSKGKVWEVSSLHTLYDTGAGEQCYKPSGLDLIFEMYSLSTPVPKTVHLSL